MAYINLPGSTTLLNVNSIPDTCPFCHNEIIPNYISAHFHQYSGIKEYAILCTCPLPVCSKVFIAHYNWDLYSNSWEFSGISFENPAEIQLPPDVAEILKDFILLYNQSIQAEQTGLTELCWLGYKRSLDLLVKDFLSNKHPLDKNRIKNLPVSDCIYDYIDDEIIKEVSRRFNSLDSDQQNHPEEIKRLIQIILRWIEIEAINVQAAESSQFLSASPN